MKREIRYIVIHTTATGQNATVAGIQRAWKERGWSSPGYHRLIEANGTIHNLSHFDRPTNGVKGFNHESIHISYVGGLSPANKPVDNRTDKQKAAILDCIREALEYVGKPVIIQGHRDFEGVKKECPCFDAKSEYKWITV
jgi:N-acetylmuramoyl-L-alanine amidase